MTDLPHNTEAEQALLGALLLNNDVMHKIADLEADHFFDPVHAQIFESCQTKIAAGELVSPVTMKFAVQDLEIGEIRGPAYLVRLAGAGASMSSAKSYAETISELHQRRTVMEACTLAIERAGEAQGGAVEDIRADLEAKLADTYNLNEKTGPYASFSQSLVGAIEAANEAYKGGAPRGMQTGLKSVDDYLGAFKPGQVYIIAARPSMGKTAVALNLATRAPNGVVFASLEMTDEALANRVISQRLRENEISIPYRNIENGWLNEADFRKVVEASQSLLKTNMITIKPGNNELSKLLSAIRSAIRQIQKKTKLDMIVVDFLQLVTVKGSGKFDSIGEVTRAFKALALQYDVPVVILSQLNRGVEARDNKRPTLSDLRGSGEIEEHGDNILFCYRHSYYLEREIEQITDPMEKTEAQADLAAIQNDMELIVAKQKNGKIGTIRLGCEIRFNHLYDKEEQTEAAF